MKAQHKLEIDIKTTELAEMLANATPAEFTQFWMDWEKHMTAERMDAIAKRWSGFSNGKRVFNDFLAMINYHEITKP